MGGRGQGPRVSARPRAPSEAKALCRIDNLRFTLQLGPAQAAPIANGPRAYLEVDLRRMKM